MAALHFLAFSLATFWHIALWIRLFDYVHAVGLSCRVVKPLEKVIVLTCWALMLWWVVGQWWVGGSLLWPSLVETDPFTFGYYFLCLAGGVIFLLLWLSRPLRHRKPDQFVQHRTELFELAQHTDEPLIGSKTARLLMRVPGNQITGLQVEEKVFRLENLPAELDGWSIVHLSDLHFTGHLTPAFFEQVVQQANQLDADLVALTGDVVDYVHCLDWIEPVLGQLRSREGGYFVLGNHDVRVHQEARLRQALAAAGLVDAGPRSTGRWQLHVTRGTEILIAGNESPWFPPLPDLSSAPEPRSAGGPFRLLLSHSPDQIGWAKYNQFDLMLAGHTHGGQFRLPWLGPFVAPSKYGVRYASGEFFEQPTLMQVSRGLSGLQPLRLNCPPELTKLVLRANT